MDQVAQVQDVLQNALDELSKARSEAEINALQMKVDHLKRQADDRMLMLKVTKNIPILPKAFLTFASTKDFFSPSYASKATEILNSME